MSETVHYKGVATKVEIPKDKTLIEVAKGILEERKKEIAPYYQNALECLVDEFYDDYFLYIETQTLYSITKLEHDLDDEIIEASENNEGNIDYELKFYNGGASFSECLEEAMDKMNKKNIVKNEKLVMYCIEIDRSGLPEENMVEHMQFKLDVDNQTVLDYILSLDCGYNDIYCGFNYYPV